MYYLWRNRDEIVLKGKKQIIKINQRIKSMKKAKKIAWLLSFALMISAIFGNINLRVAAAGEGTSFTITVDDQSNVTGNQVNYSFDNSSWNSVSSGDAIDISDKQVIYVQAQKADGVNVDCSESTGFPTEQDFGGITGGGTGSFDLQTAGQTYHLRVKFTKSNTTTNNLTFSYDRTDLSCGEVQWKDSEENWHTQTTNGSVSATAVRIKYSNNGTLASHTALRVNGANILPDNNIKNALESDNGLALDAEKNYSFENIEFISGDGPLPQGPPAFDGSAYFVWQGANDAFCVHKITGLTGQAGDGTYPINYIMLSTVKDDVSNEPFAIDNSKYYWVRGSKGDELFETEAEQLTNTRKYNQYSSFDNYLKSDEQILREIAIDPCGAENGESTVCTNGDREFRATIYEDSTFEGVAFDQNKNNYTYFPNFWDNAVFTNTVDISGTTESTPAIYEAFILEPTIRFGKADNSANAFTGIRALNVPDGAVTITGDAASGYGIVFGSNFFDNVAFEITTASGNYYLEIVRTAIQVHDTAGPGEVNPTIVAEVYYDNAKSYSDYDVYATIHYADGSMGIQKASVSEFTMDELGNPVPPGTYEMNGGNGLTRAQYSIPLTSNMVGVYFNAVESGALSGTTFGGSYFGSGKGVYYDVATREVSY